MKTRKRYIKDGNSTTAPGPVAGGLADWRSVAAESAGMRETCTPVATRARG